MTKLSLDPPKINKKKYENVKKYLKISENSVAKI